MYVFNLTFMLNMNWLRLLNWINAPLMMASCCWLYINLLLNSVFISLIIGENDVEYSLCAQSAVSREREAAADQNTGHVG
jgi:hypothetical protein